jgi:uncharacterized protein with HEPN domain
MRLEAAKFLRDILLDAADRITNYTRGKARVDYLTDELLHDAVHWNFAVIGEALSQLQKADQDVTNQINEWRRIIAFRNQLIHGYGVIKNEITWDIIENKLPVLLSDGRKLLDTAGGSQ